MILSMIFLNGDLATRQFAVATVGHAIKIKKRFGASESGVPRGSHLRSPLQHALGPRLFHMGTCWAPSVSLTGKRNPDPWEDLKIRSPV